MNWIFIAIIPTILWSLVNYVDKAVISRFFTGKGEVAVITTGFAGLVMALFILIFQPGHITDITIFYRIIAVLNGAVFVLAFMPYCKALEIDDASRAVMVYQTIPVFGFLLGFLFLHEHFGFYALFGGLLILLGSTFVMLDSVDGKWYLKRKTLLLMLLSSFMTALHVFVFKFISLEQTFWSTGFWVYVGMALCGLVLYLIPTYYKQFNDAVRGHVGVVLVLGTITEIMSITGLSIVAYVSLRVPISAVQVVNGFQPFVIIILGYLLTKLLPKYFNESFSKKHLAIKVVSFIVMLVGVVLVSKFV